MRAMGITVGLVLGAAALALPSCNSSVEPTFQGWIEANLIFVSPDESGRVETLAAERGIGRNLDALEALWQEVKAEEK